MLSPADLRLQAMQTTADSIALRTTLVAFFLSPFRTMVRGHGEGLRWIIGSGNLRLT